MGGRLLSEHLFLGERHTVRNTRIILGVLMVLKCYERLSKQRI